MNGRRIVVATDGSANSQEAVEIGIDLALTRGADVTFVHFSPIAQALFEAHPIDGPTPEQIKQADPVLAAAAESASKRGVSAELVIQADHGAANIASLIAGIAEGSDADLIVVGTRGHGPLATAVLGSVSHGLLREATLPVVVVRG